MAQTKRPVRINILNKELWEKEIKLMKRWKLIANIYAIFTIISFIGFGLSVAFWHNPPHFMGFVYCGLYIFICFSGIFVLGKYKIHGEKAYEYKFGKKHNVK